MKADNIQHRRPKASAGGRATRRSSRMASAALSGASRSNQQEDLFMQALAVKNTARKPIVRSIKAPLRETAESMAGKQKEIAVSEFFAKNRHLLGFDNPRKA